ncbi:MAG: hypothetical protein M3430_03725 [Acidobacteriota bacterium]|nr:hypothetical protein [Acidobacteriota bacterium]
MNYLELNSAKKILEAVAGNDGQLTWYSIVKRVDQEEDVERVPPSYHVLKELTKLGYLRTDSPTLTNDSRYSLTEIGHAYVLKSVVDASREFHLEV